MADQSSRVFDELLVTLARGGDVRAAERLAARWRPRLLRTARRLIGDADKAEDAVQEAWAAISAGWPALSDPAKFPAWAFGILRRKCIDAIRRASRDRHRLTPLNGHEIGAPASRAETLTALDQAFAALTPDHRVAAILFFGEGLALSEIAAATGAPLGTVKSRLFHARRHLKAVLQGEVA